jgi:hypothetical protein
MLTFPTSLYALKRAGVSEHLDDATLQHLKESEQELQRRLQISPILLARSEQRLSRAFQQAFRAAADYYVEASVLIWRALGHDHRKLLLLSQSTTRVIEEEFWRNRKKLTQRTFVKAVAAVRVLEKVGSWVIRADEVKAHEAQIPLLSFMGYLVFATFLTHCLLAYITGEFKRARPHNLELLAEGMLEVAAREFQEAAAQKLPETVGDDQAWYWSPSWQEREVEADLDIRIGHVKRFTSVQALVRDVKSSHKPDAA